MNASVWECLGRPNWAALVPGPRTEGWHAARTRLEDGIRLVGRACRIRTPGVLWGLIHTARPGGGLPQRTTWGRLCGDATLGTVLERIEARATAPGLRPATWNVRWLISPHTQQGILKRQRIMRGLNAGKVVALQETHWQTCQAAIWEGLFTGTEVVSTCARESARGAP